MGSGYFPPSYEYYVIFSSSPSFPSSSPFPFQKTSKSAEEIGSKTSETVSETVKNISETTAFKKVSEGVKVAKDTVQEELNESDLYNRGRVYTRPNALQKRSDRLVRMDQVWIWFLEHCPKGGGAAAATGLTVCAIWSQLFVLSNRLIMNFFKTRC